MRKTASKHFDMETLDKLIDSGQEGLKKKKFYYFMINITCKRFLIRINFAFLINNRFYVQLENIVEVYILQK